MLRVVDERADQVGRQQVRRELDPAKRRVDRACQGPDGHRLRQLGHPFHQDVTVGEQPHEQPLDHVSLADDDPAHFVEETADKGALGMDLLLNRFDVMVHPPILG